MKKNLLIPIILILTSSCSMNWRLPLHNGKVQYEFDSKQIQSKKQTLCENYLSANTRIDFFTLLTESTANGKDGFFRSSNSNFVGSTLYGADVTVGDLQIAPCSPGNDTLIGSFVLTINQNRIDFGLSNESRSVVVKCLFRVVLKENSYNLKFRGFKITESNISFLGKVTTETKPIEQMYKESTKAYSGLWDRSDRFLWSNLNTYIEMFHINLEKAMSRQESDFNFDD